MSPRDHERRQTEPVPQILGVPSDRRDGNGKRWWNEVWGKVMAGLLLALAIVLASGAWAKAKDGYAATVEVYGLPVRVTDHETRLKAIESSSKAPMPAEQVSDLAKAIAAELSKQKPKTTH